VANPQPNEVANPQPKPLSLMVGWVVGGGPVVKEKIWSC